jgi:hypothetical protein
MTQLYDEIGRGYQTYRRPDPRIAAATGAGVARLRRDLEDGSWVRRHGDLLTLTELDLGYRLVVARRAAAPEEARS